MFHFFSLLFFFSDQDTDVNALLNTWLKGQPEQCRGNLNNWLGDYFQRALDWIFKQVPVLLAFVSNVFFVLNSKSEQTV